MVTRSLTSAKCIGVEKRIYPTRHHVYILNVNWSDGVRYTVYRHYSSFFDLQGQIRTLLQGTDIAVPELPAVRFFERVWRIGKDSASEKKIARLNEFCQAIIKLPQDVIQAHSVDLFFQLWSTDHDDTSSTSKMLDNSRKPIPIIAQTPRTSETNDILDQVKINSTLDIDRLDDISTSSKGSGHNSDEAPFGQYFRVICDYQSNKDGELPLIRGQVVDVIEKNPSGWWFVCVEETGDQGWAPGTFLKALLEPSAQADSQSDEDEVAVGRCKAICAYNAQGPDEVSYHMGDEIELLAYNFNGWWKVRVNGKVGLTPAVNMKLIHTENKKLTSTMRASVSSIENLMCKRGPPPRRSLNMTKKSEKENSSPASSTSIKDLDDEMFYPHMNNSFLDSDNDIQSSDSKTNAMEKKVKKTVTIKLPPTGRAEKLRELFIKAKNRRKNKNVKEKPSALRQNRIENSKDSMDDLAHSKNLKQYENVTFGETNVSDGDSNSYNSDSGVSMQIDGKYKREKNRRIHKIHNIKTNEILKKEEAVDTIRMKKDGKIHYVDVEIQQSDQKRVQPPKFGIIKNGETTNYSKILLKKDKAVQCEQEEDNSDEESEEEEKLVYPKSPHMLKFTNLRPSLTSRLFNARYENVNSSPPPPLSPLQIRSVKDSAKDEMRVSVRAVYSLKSTSPQTLSFTAGDIGQLIERNSNGWWFIRVCDQEGWSPANHWEILEKPVPIPRKKEVRFPDTATCDWFIGKIGRRDCESRLLRNAQDREFMIRESTTRVDFQNLNQPRWPPLAKISVKDNEYTLSVRYKNRVLHFPIETTRDCKFLFGQYKFGDLSEIVAYYQENHLFTGEKLDQIKLGKPYKRT